MPEFNIAKRRVHRGDQPHETRAEKPVEWRGSSLDDLRAFPDDARRDAGFQLGRMQLGYQPADWRPMPDVGAGALEIRIHVLTEHRVFVVAKFEEALYVLHAFEKKSQKTSERDMNIAVKRYRQLIGERLRK